MLKTLNVLEFYFQNSRLKVLEFPKLALKSLEFVNVSLSSLYECSYA